MKRTMTTNLTPEEMAVLASMGNRAPSQPVDLDARLKEAAVALAVATVASCDCDTKTPDPEFHRSDCTYASLRMAMARVDRIIQRRANASSPSGEDASAGKDTRDEPLPAPVSPLPGGGEG